MSTPFTITRTTLCVCHHIYSMHNQEADCTLCRCSRFQATSRKSSSHYQRGQLTGRKRVARLEVGDRVLVGFPGHEDYVRGRDGALVWVKELGELLSHPLTKHVEDEQLRPVENKTGALVAIVTATSRITDGWQIETNLGPLPVPLAGHHAVHVVLAPTPWEP